MSGYAIQRLTFSGMLDQSFRLMRDHFVAITLPFIVLYVPYSLTMDALGLSQFGADPRQILAVVWKLLTVLVVFVVAASFAQLVVTNVIADCYLARQISVPDAARRALSTFLPYVGTSFLATLALIPLIVLIITIPLAFFFGVSWMLVGAIVVIERQYGTKALKRSRALIKGHFWESFAVMLVAGLLVSMASGALSVAFSFIPIVGPVLNGVVQAITSAYLSAVLIVLYVDLRCRHEDFDLQRLAQQIAGPGAGALPGPLPSAAAAPADDNAAAG
jgi:hypothetical protein